jgi:hypothetical protein
MNKRGKARIGGVVLMGALLLVAGTVWITGAARATSSAMVGSPNASGRGGAEIVPGIARADADTLDLQLD